MKKNYLAIRAAFIAILSCLLITGQSVALAANPQLPGSLLDFNYINSTLGSDYLEQQLYRDLTVLDLEPSPPKDIFDDVLYQETSYVFLLAVGVTAGLYFAPQEISQWDDDEKNFALIEHSG